MIETNLFSLAASVMSSNLCWGSSILKNPSLNTLERERAKIPSAIYHEQLFSLLGINDISVAPSEGFRMPPFYHVHVLSETVN